VVEEAAVIEYRQPREADLHVATQADDPGAQAHEAFEALTGATLSSHISWRSS
jgi:hypothetical protein